MSLFPKNSLLQLISFQILLQMDCEKVSHPDLFIYSTLYSLVDQVRVVARRQRAHDVRVVARRVRKRRRRRVRAAALRRRARVRRRRRRHAAGPES